MSVSETRYEHIVLLDTGVPCIVGTTMKVSELVREHDAYGWSAEELHFQHPYLSLGQIYSALAYYWDHKADLDAEIAHRRTRVAELRALEPRTTLHDRVQAQRDQHDA